jgi:hypothetical protein
MPCVVSQASPSDLQRWMYCITTTSLHMVVMQYIRHCESEGLARETMPCARRACRYVGGLNLLCYAFLEFIMWLCDCPTL